MSRLVHRLSLLLAPGLLLCAGAYAASIDGTYAGRYQCGLWHSAELRIADAGNGRVAAVFTIPVVVQARSTRYGSYRLSGSYDAASGEFRLDPEAWIGQAPAGWVMSGLEGTLDPASGRITGKLLNRGCGGLELALRSAGGSVPPSVSPGRQVAGGPAPPPVSPATQVGFGATEAAGSLPPERRRFSTNVTGSQAERGFEYLDASMFVSPGTLRESEPIDDMIDWLRKNGYTCASSNPVLWNGTRGTAADRVSVTEVHAIECNGNCQGVWYRPWADAIIVHYGVAQPVPLLLIKTTWFGGVQLRWDFARPDAATPAPYIVVHKWTVSPFNSSPTCRPPKANAR